MTFKQIRITPWDILVVCLPMREQRFMGFLSTNLNMPLLYLLRERSSSPQRSRKLHNTVYWCDTNCFFPCIISEPRHHPRHHATSQKSGHQSKGAPTLPSPHSSHVAQTGLVHGTEIWSNTNLSTKWTIHNAIVPSINLKLSNDTIDDVRKI